LLRFAALGLPKSAPALVLLRSKCQLRSGSEAVAQRLQACYAEEHLGQLSSGARLRQLHSSSLVWLLGKVRLLAPLARSVLGQLKEAVVEA